MSQVLPMQRKILIFHKTRSLRLFGRHWFLRWPMETGLCDQIAETQSWRGCRRRAGKALRAKAWSMACSLACPCTKLRATLFSVSRMSRRCINSPPLASGVLDDEPEARSRRRRISPPAQDAAITLLANHRFFLLSPLGIVTNNSVTSNRVTSHRGVTLPVPV
jgi:hypothetical protein